MDEIDPQPQIMALLESGLSVESIQPRLHSVFPLQNQPEPRDSRTRVDAFRESIETFAPHFPGVTFITVTGQAPGGNFKEAYAEAGRFYRELGIIAEANGVSIALEPLNPVSMNVDSFICSLAHARRLIDAAASPAFGLCIDTWHLWEDESIAYHLREIAAKIFAVHISDWRTPRSPRDRALPGDGIIPLQTFLRTIHDSGYDGIYTLELFSDLTLEDSLWRQPRQTIDTGRAKFAHLWSEITGWTEVAKTNADPLNKRVSVLA